MRDRIYTITGKIDGFGAQYLAVMSGLAYCRYMGYTYEHTPFVSVAHGADPHEMDTFIGFKRYTNGRKPDISECFSSTVHWSPNPVKYYTKEVINEIRDRYYSSEKPFIDLVDVAIHIRRGDVTPIQSAERWIDTSYYGSVIKHMKEKYPSYKITIFSEGTVEDFEDIVFPGVECRLNGCIKDAFHGMVSAKVLVTSMSAFSYAAAILNDGVVYYEPFWHKPLCQWINLRNII